MTKQRLLELAEYCHTHGKNQGQVNDVQFVANLSEVRPEVESITSWANFSKMLKYWRELKQYEENVEEVEKVEAKKVKYTPPDNGESFYDSVGEFKL